MDQYPFNRRTFISSGLASAGLLHPAFAQSTGTGVVTNPPLESGHADFSGAWSPNFPIAELVAAAPDIPKGAAETFGGTQLTSIDEVNSFVKSTVGTSTFLAWFNATVADQSEWGGVRAVGDDLEAHFQSYWTQATVLRTYTAMEFLTYMAVFLNECRGNLTSTDESFEARQTILASRTFLMPFPGHI